MTCTIAAIVALLGFMPPPGSTLTIPRSMVSQWSVSHQLKAKKCATRYGVILAIDESK